MPKKLVIAGTLLIVLITAIIIMWQNYELSSDYNYFTAKLDIKNGRVQVVNVGSPVDSSKDKEIEMAAAKYGFKNIYIKLDTTIHKMKGINNYNEVVEAYLVLRNGNNWRATYQKEVDSLYRAASNKNNSSNEQH